HQLVSCRRPAGAAGCRGHAAELGVAARVSALPTLPRKRERNDWLARLDAADRRLFERLTRNERQVADRSLRQLSNSANRSMLWFAIAGLIAMLGGRAGRRAALRGIVSIAITSTLVNLPLKYLARRERPASRGSGRPLPVSMPGRFSFPSGHSASAFAFATGVGIEEPWLLPAILPLAAGVAYSRVHLRVHYPFDVLVGAAIGPGGALPVRRAGGSGKRQGDGPRQRSADTRRPPVVGSSDSRACDGERRHQPIDPGCEPARWERRQARQGQAPDRRPRTRRGGRDRGRRSSPAARSATKQRLATT